MTNLLRCALAVLAVLGPGGCQSTSPAAPPDSGASPDAAACEAATADVCAGRAGTFHDQPIVIDGETRYFWLHVPPSATSGSAPLLLDFHGTGFDANEPEEEWGIDELTAVSDTLGFIVVRPRSHSYTVDGQLYFQWDLSAEDLKTTLDLTAQLVAFLDAHYAIDAARTYVAGFSNGTNMALQTLQMSPNPFKGIGLVGGGIYEPFPIALPSPPPRIWDTSGYRDLNYEFQRDMQAWLASNGYPASSLLIRETKALHELRGWMYGEMFAWLDAGTKPVDGTLSAGWTREAFPSPTTTLLTAARAADGTLIATGQDGSIWSRGASGWTASQSPSGAPVLIGACIDADGTGFATGEAQNFATGDHGATWTPAASIPLAGYSDEASTELFGLACGPVGTLVGGGSVVAAKSTDAGATWTTSTPQALIFTIRRGSSGAWIAVGPNYVGRSLDGLDFVETDVAAELYDVAEAAPGVWFAVGVDGAMLESTDDAVSWTPLAPTIASSLYAIRFASPLVGAAVGANGAAIVTQDGGASWQARAAGIDRMLGDLAWLDPGHAVVIGERGLVLDLQP